MSSFGDSRDLALTDFSFSFEGRLLVVVVVVVVVVVIVIIVVVEVVLVVVVIKSSPTPPATQLATGTAIYSNSLCGLLVLAHNV